jgi:hypothetical protein
MRKKILFVLMGILACAIIVPSVYCQQTEQPSYNGTGRGESMLFDLIFLRPLGIAACAIGTAGTIISLPFAIPTGRTGEVVNALMTEPGDYTFVRPLGQTGQ